MYVGGVGIVFGYLCVCTNSLVVKSMLLMQWTYFVKMTLFPFYLQATSHYIYFSKTYILFCK